jgi:hypothetical protein
VQSCENAQAEQAAEKEDYFVILSGATNLSWFYAREKKERFFAPLRMTKGVGSFSSTCEARATKARAMPFACERCGLARSIVLVSWDVR